MVNKIVKIKGILKHITENCPLEMMKSIGEATNNISWCLNKLSGFDEKQTCKQVNKFRTTTRAQNFKNKTKIKPILNSGQEQKL